MIIRPILPEEHPLLETFIYEAIFVPPGEQPPPREIIFQPDVHAYIKDFGTRPEDCCVVAEIDGQAVGAAWAGVFGAYGYIDDETPELAIAVLPPFRGQGIGTALLDALFAQLKQRGCGQTSLAVQQANPAARLYLRMGYEIVAEKEEEYFMLKQLEADT